MFRLITIEIEEKFCRNVKFTSRECQSQIVKDWRILPSGQGVFYHLNVTPAKYRKYSHSAGFAFSVPAKNFKLKQFALNNTLAFSVGNREMRWSRRLNSINQHISNCLGMSNSDPHIEMLSILRFRNTHTPHSPLPKVI